MNIRCDAPTIKSRIDEDGKAHHAVLNNPYWFSDKPELLDQTFSANNTKTRSRVIIDILRRAANCKTAFANQYSALADKLSDCGGNIRCGSAACLNCLRAFQQAKTAGHSALIAQVAQMQPKKPVYLVTIIPREHTYRRNAFHEFDTEAFKALLRAPLNSFFIPFVGSIDFSVEFRKKAKYIQPHFHLIMHVSDCDELRERLKWHFPPLGKYEHPVDLKEMGNLKVVSYIHKAMKINHLLRNGRRYLPELLLTLDSIKPLDLMVMHDVVLSAQQGLCNFEPIQHN
jgi:hypothetical protein